MRKQARKHSSGKDSWLKTLHGRVRQRLLLEEACGRALSLVETMGGQWRVYQTESRFVTGLGRSHPVENGFAWHPTLGTPYLPGSSLKGLVRAWAHDEGTTDVSVLFGQSGAVGRLCFLDALPLSAPNLDVEVMTPHYANWSKDDVPGDWRSPTPIPFLTVAPGQRFLFAIVPGKRTAISGVERAMDYLDEALTWLGAGAKTAVGYGRFTRDVAQEKELSRRVKERQEQLARECEEKARIDKASPVERELLEMAKDAADSSHVVWIKAAEEGRWDADPSVKRKVLQHVEREMRQRGNWKPTTGKLNNAAKKWTRKVEQMLKELPTPEAGEPE